jgi:hypothetical protein
MLELAARHGFDAHGNSLTASDEDDDQYSEPERRSHFGGASANYSPQPSAAPSRASRTGKSKDHRGVTFDDMKRIFDALVLFRLLHECICYTSH